MGIGEKVSPIQGSILRGRAYFQAFGLRYSLFDPLGLSAACRVGRGNLGSWGGKADGWPGWEVGCHG
ncbi:MAG: hypothetical protein DCC46_05165 [Armatimonadetes bacterium]|nr:MAG: hypothetical protein DCC46_05165 [Armatimonadota bacterium]